MTQKWTKVEDGLPDSPRDVNIWDGVAVQNDCYIAGYGWECGHNGVTHWHELLAPPEAE